MINLYQKAAVLIFKLEYLEMTSNFNSNLTG